METNDLKNQFIFFKKNKSIFHFNENGEFKIELKENCLKVKFHVGFPLV